MKVLVTGATGMIGSAVCRHLASAGLSVRAAVRSQPVDVTGASEIATTGNLSGETDWRPALEEIDAVVHIAGLAHVPSREAAEQLRTTNDEATARLVRDASAAGVGRFVFLSTVKVNGENSPPSGFTEKDPPAPADAYAISKARAEEHVRESKLDFTIVRTPLVYGPRVRANFLSLLRAVDRGVPLPFGALDNRRSLICVDNLASALAWAIRSERAARKTFLVSDNDDVSTPQLIRRIAAALERPARLINVPPGVLRAAAMLAGKSAAIEKLIGTATVNADGILHAGWRPATAMQEGLRATAAWFRAQKATS